MKENTLRKTTSQTKTSSTTTTEQKLDTGSIAIVGSMGFISAFIGGGAVICFISALVNAGPLELIQGFLSALSVI